MIVNPERIFNRFSRVQNPDLMKSPVWQKYKQDFMDYFTQFENADEAKNFNNVTFYPCLADDLPSTPIDPYYFYQDTWASKKIFERKPESVLDIGSTVFYAGIISQFAPTTFVNIRPVNLNLPGLTVVDGSILDLPFTDASQNFITSLCVLEHIGLGRYGDPIMPDGTKSACAEIDRVLKPQGEIVVSVPLGKTCCIAFNAHRIFSRGEFLSYFAGYEVLDEIYLNPEPSGSEILNSLDIGEFVVWVVHLKKGIDREIENWVEQGNPVSLPHKFNSVSNKYISTSLSDNQIYPQVCIEASNDYRSFNSFRRNPIYNEILEHISENQGREYLNIISKDPDVLSAINNFKLNDEYGSPIMYEYSGIGIISPTTLRYIKVLADLKKHFQTLNSLNICEIGVGYGGQCRIINAYYSPSMYCLVDIQPALSLAQRFLDNYIIHSVLTYKTMNELSQRDYDLVLSNYAFTELPRSVQDIYLNKVILRSKRGYITYNETTPSEFNSYKSGELIEIISGSRIFKEEPLTHPKNCIIVWGENAE
ncbi:MAG: putative sugar O-methyltransferase [Nostocales cyanobacterium ELA583]|jgi:putative sugar O-methyltransferase